MVKRKVISIIISALILFAALTSFTISLVELKKQNDVQPKAYWNFSSGILSPTDTTNYGNNSSFFIDTQQAFYNFRDSVARGCTFEQKKVILELDIDLSGKNWYPIGCRSNGTFLTDFKGTFDGRNNTISNMTCTYQYNDNHARFGLFASCDAAKRIESNPVETYYVYPGLRNLRFVNPSISVGDKSNYLIGVLAASIGGDYIIENISVDGLSITTFGQGGEYHCNVYIGGFFGDCQTNNSNIKITNCYINYSKLDIKHQQHYCYYAGIGPADLNGKATNITVTMNQCVVKYSSTYNIAWKPWVSVSNVYTVRKYAYGVQDNSITNVCTMNPGTGNAYPSSVYGFSSYSWFYDAKYNDGYPIITTWLTMQAYYFSINNPNAWEGLSLSTSGEGWQFYSYSNQYVLSVPNDVSPTIKDATVEILSRSITAESSEDYIACTGWTKDSNYYYANFGLRTFTVNFELASGAQASYNEYTSLTVLYGEEITVKRSTNADYIFYYEFTVTNDSGSKVWTKCFMNDRKYELKDWDTLKSKTWTITEDTTITLDTTEKEYGSVWQ